jgi:peptidoglycan/LPS O-acetylase OafA/YrhL
MSLKGRLSPNELSASVSKQQVMAAQTNSMNRIIHIEGLRAFLAFWVLCSHVLCESGYTEATLNPIAKKLWQGWFAVDVFVIVSGFVIFYLLDHKREKYLNFIANRFFRVWPLFIILFLVSIPLSQINGINKIAFFDLFPNSAIQVEPTTAPVSLWSQNTLAHVLLHLPMLHGVVPQAILPNAPSAYLAPAWSISLEWQFYLIAPLIFWRLQPLKKYSILMVSAGVLIAFFIGKIMPFVEYGAFLPMHIEYFYAGGLSYFLFKRLQSSQISIEFFPIGLTLSILLLFNPKFNVYMLPCAIWLNFFSILLDIQKTQPPPYIKLIAKLFSNPIAVYLGKISYSIYLSHMLVIIASQYFLLKYFPTLSQEGHMYTLGAITIIVTLAISHILYKVIELRGIALGKNLVNKLNRRLERRQGA